MNRDEDAYPDVGNIQQEGVMAPATTNPRKRSSKEKYKKILYGLGIVEIIIGGLSFILGIAAVGISYRSHCYYHPLAYSVHGIWCGVFAIVVGILGIKARSNPSQCINNANMALSIIGAFVMGMLSLISGISAGIPYPSIIISLLIVYSILILLGLAGLVVMIIHSAYCCAGACCESKPRVPVYYYQSPIGMLQPQLIQLSNGQYVLAPMQAIAAPYNATQNSVIVGHMAYQYSQQGSHVTQMPAPSTIMNAALPRTVGPSVTQQATNSNLQQATQTGNEEEANEDPPEYSTLPRNE